MSEKRELKSSGELKKGSHCSESRMRTLSTEQPNKKAKITQQHNEEQKPCTIPTVPMIPYNNTFDVLPDEVATKIIYYVGIEYLGIGVVNRRLNKIFKDSDIPNETVPGGYTYASLEDMINEFDTEYDKKEEDYYEEWSDYPDICSHIATGIAYYDRIDLFEWATEEKNKFVLYEISIQASACGKLSILRKIFGISDEESREYMQQQHCYYNGTIEAAKHGHLDCLKFLHENGFQWDSDACKEAARAGKLDCLKYLNEHGCWWDHEACSGAAGNGQLECLKYLHQNGCPWNYKACSAAAAAGHIECLKYLHEHGCQWSSNACDEATKGGNLECLQYLLKHGCECTSEASERAAALGKLL